MRQNDSEAETSLTLVSPAAVSPYSPVRVLSRHRTRKAFGNTNVHENTTWFGNVSFYERVIDVSDGGDACASAGLLPDVTCHGRMCFFVRFRDAELFVSDSAGMPVGRDDAIGGR